MKKDDFKDTVKRYGDAVITYRSQNSRKLKYNVCTLDFDNKYIQEKKNRAKEDDSSVPYLDNGYYYYTRFEKGKQYPIYCRKKEKLSSEEEILINVNEMSKGHEYFKSKKNSEKTYYWNYLP